MFDRICKNKIYLTMFIVCISFFITLPLLFNVLYEDGSDLVFHVQRIDFLYRNIKEGIFLPAVHMDNMCGYGYNIDIFYPSLFNYFPAVLTFLTKNSLRSFIIWIFVFNIFTYFLNYKIFDICFSDKRKAFYFALFYLVFPYRLMDFYLNGFLGIFYAYTFIPMVVFGIERLFKNNKWIMLTLGMCALVYSHTLSLLLCSVYILIYCIINIKKLNKNIVFNLIKATVFSVLIGCSFLIPFIDNYIGFNYKVNLNSSISGIVAYGPSLSFMLKIFIQIIIVISLFFIYKKIRIKEPERISKYLIAIIYVVLMSFSIFPWEIIEKIPFLNTIQYSNRILWLIIPLVVYILADTCSSMKDMDFVISIICISFIPMVLTTKMYYFQRGDNEIISNYSEYFKIDNQGPFLNVSAGEFVPADFSVNNKNVFEITGDDLLENNIPVFSNVVNDFKYEKTGPLEYTVTFNSDSNVDVQIPLLYYKYYKAYNNNQEINVYENNGCIYLKGVSEGEITVRYEINNIQYISLIISLISLISIIFLKEKPTLKVH